MTSALDAITQRLAASPLIADLAGSVQPIIDALTAERAALAGELHGTLDALTLSRAIQQQQQQQLDALQTRLDAALHPAPPAAPYRFGDGTRSSYPADLAAGTALPAAALTAALPTSGTVRYVATTGNDTTGDGSVGNPYATIAQAISLGSQATIVLRGGTYRQAWTSGGRTTITLQPYPGETVWIDGADDVTARPWTAEGSGWSLPFSFAAFPLATGGYIAGAPAGAADPTQVWIDGVPLRAVGSTAALVAGTYVSDRTNSRMVIGTDPATAGTIEVSARVQCLIDPASTDWTVRGLGFRHFSPTVGSTQAALRVQGAGTLVEHCTFTQNTGDGLNVDGNDTGQHGTDVEVRGCVSVENGHCGGSAGRQAHRLHVHHCLLARNNQRRYSMTNAAAGWKALQMDAPRFHHNVVRANAGAGIWLDETVERGQVARNRCTDNAYIGIKVELSPQCLIVGNEVRGNAAGGIDIGVGSPACEGWHNTVLDNANWAVRVQDDRRAPLRPTANSTGITQSVVLKNNLLGTVTGVAAQTVLDVRRNDDPALLTGEQMLSGGMDGNVYLRRAAQVPATLISWQNVSATAPAASLRAFQAAHATLEPHGSELTGSDPFIDQDGRDYRLTPASGLRGRALPVIGMVATLLGVPDGTTPDPGAIQPTTEAS